MNGDLIMVGKIIIVIGLVLVLLDIFGIGDVFYFISMIVFEFFELLCLLLVIGGGYIGCELV